MKREVFCASCVTQGWQEGGWSENEVRGGRLEGRRANELTRKSQIRRNGWTSLLKTSEMIPRKGCLCVCAYPHPAESGPTERSSFSPLPANSAELRKNAL